MNAYQKRDGGVNLSVREYDIGTATAVKAGQVVQLSEGLVIAAVAAQTGAVLGIAAENHTGAYDALNPRANGDKILVYDDPGLLFTCAAPRMTATGGTATTITASTLGAFANDDFNGGFLMLMKKGAASTNSDPLGTVKRITDYGYNSTGTVSTFTVDSGAAACAGDEYLVFPPVGFAKGNLNATFDGLVLTATAALALKVVGRHEDSGKLVMMAKSHTLG